MQKCKPLPKLVERDHSGKEVIQILVDTQNEYRDCALIHNKLIDLIEKRITK